MARAEKMRTPDLTVPGKLDERYGWRIRIGVGARDAGVVAWWLVEARTTRGQVTRWLITGYQAPTRRQSGTYMIYINELDASRYHTHDGIAEPVGGWKSRDPEPVLSPCVELAADAQCERLCDLVAELIVLRGRLPAVADAASWERAILHLADFVTGKLVKAS